MSGLRMIRVMMALGIALSSACAPPAVSVERNELGCYDTWQDGIPQMVSSRCRFDVSCMGKASFEECANSAGTRGSFEALCFDGCLLAGCVDAWTDAAAICEAEKVDYLDPAVQEILAECDEQFVGPPCLAKR